MSCAVRSVTASVPVHMYMWTRSGSRSDDWTGPLVGPCAGTKGQSSVQWFPGHCTVMSNKTRDIKTNFCVVIVVSAHSERKWKCQPTQVCYKATLGRLSTQQQQQHAQQLSSKPREVICKIPELRRIVPFLDFWKPTLQGRKGRADPTWGGERNRDAWTHSDRPTRQRVTERARGRGRERDKSKLRC